MTHGLFRSNGKKLILHLRQMQLKIQGRGYLNNNKDDAMKEIRQSSYWKSNQDEQVVIIMKQR